MYKSISYGAETFLIHSDGTITDLFFNPIPQYTNHWGYKLVMLDKLRLVHQVVASVFNLYPESTDSPVQVDHINGVRDDNRLENLRVISISDNHRTESFRKKQQAIAVQRFHTRNVYAVKFPDGSYTVGSEREIRSRHSEMTYSPFFFARKKGSHITREGITVTLLSSRIA